MFVVAGRGLSSLFGRSLELHRIAAVAAAIVVVVDALFDCVGCVPACSITVSGGLGAVTMLWTYLAHQL